MADEDEHSFLIDWEPATIFGQSRHDGSCHVETMPFMALALLNEEYWEGKMKRQYHHDLEGFLWILPFVCLQYENGDVIRNPPLKSWNTENYAFCRLLKLGFLNDIEDGPALLKMKATPSHEMGWILFCGILPSIHKSWSPQSGSAFDLFLCRSTGVEVSEDAYAKEVSSKETYLDFWKRVKTLANSPRTKELMPNLWRFVPVGLV